ncbi:purine-nucleoside phosphorylase [Eubacterium ruminantium]|nr:purine-nucleoside phosphorylase [Eubacterium ruminantium]
MIEYEKLIRSSCDTIKNIIHDDIPEIGIVLGSGLGELAEEIEDSISIPYSELEGFPVSTVEGHNGRFVIGRLKGKKVIVMQGRVHYYEGYDTKIAVLPVRVMCFLGIKRLLLTNAAGGINEALSPGGFMVISDHISLFVTSPLIGKNLDMFGVRFPDMSEVYDKRIADIIYEYGKAEGINIEKGVYLQTTGPQYETPAEIKMIKSLGADAVGMSTVIEAIAARHAGVKVSGISCITNMAAGISAKKLSHEEVKEVADISSKNFKKLVLKYIDID